MFSNDNMNISLALSGGGIRASVFHIGVLKFLAEQRLLERVNHISSVSGGSLAAGLIFANAGKRWPTSDDFIVNVYPAIRHTVCHRSLIQDAFFQLANPYNLRFIASRANLIEKALRQFWGLNFTLSELPRKPTWSINATNAETGKRFRFKGIEIGDYKSGYTEAGDLSVSTAVAVSAAFPALIGPLVLPTAKYRWLIKKDDSAPPEPINPSSSAFHLYDGGLYDNLGLEPLFDVGTRRPRVGIDVIIASDAGAPLAQGLGARSLNPMQSRLKRIIDIMSDQVRNLRVRTFVNCLIETKAGAFIQIDNPLFDKEHDSSAKFACEFPTTLRKLSEVEFDKLAGYGYAVTKRVHEKYGLGV